MTPDTPRLSLHEWSCLRTELRWIYDRAPRDQARHATYDHRRGNWAWYLRKGTVTLTTKAGPLTAKAGQWLFPPSESSRQDFSDDAHLLSVSFLCQWPSGENLFGDTAGAVVDGHRHPSLEKSAVSLERLVRRHFPVPHHTYASQSADYPLFLRFQQTFCQWLDAWFQTRLILGATPARHGGDARTLRAVRALDEAPLKEGFPEVAVRLAAGVGMVHAQSAFPQSVQAHPASILGAPPAGVFPPLPGDKRDAAQGTRRPPWLPQRLPFRRVV